jgi:magnesium-transporting ATPase (P-type)
MGSTIQKSLQRAFYPIANLRWAQNLPVLGTPTDAAMFKYVAQIVDVKLIRNKYPVFFLLQICKIRIFKIVFEIPFNSKRKWQLVIIKMKENKDGTCKYRLIMKGASEILIKTCDKIMNGKEAIPLNEEEMKNFQVTIQI